MMLQLLRPYQHFPKGEVIDLTHAGVAKELIRRGVAHEFQEARPEPQSASPSAPPSKQEPVKRRKG